MKVAMFEKKNRGVSRTVCLFICSGCGKPIENIAEANFAPVRTDDYRDPEPKELSRTYTLLVDALEIWHWDCDDAGYPWINAAEAIGQAYQSSISERGQ